MLKKISDFKETLLLLKILYTVKVKFKRQESLSFLLKMLKSLYNSKEAFIFYKNGALLIIRYLPHIDSGEIVFALNKNQILNKNKIYMKAYFEYFSKFKKYPLFVSWRRSKTNKYYSIKIDKFLLSLNSATILKYKTEGWV